MEQQDFRITIRLTKQELERLDNQRVKTGQPTRSSMLRYLINGVVLDSPRLVVRGTTEQRTEYSAAHRG